MCQEETLANSVYLFIYYIPTNCTNLLFIYKQHIKTFVLFKLLKHVGENLEV